MNSIAVILKMMDIFVTSLLQGLGLAGGVAVGVKILMHKSVAARAREKYEEALRKLGKGTE